MPGNVMMDESKRLASLDACGVLNTAPEEAFDDLTRLAARLCDAPMCLVSLVEADRIWFKSKCGVGAEFVARDGSFCTHVIDNDQELLVTDATRDARFASNPLVTGAPGVRFYAGVPLRLEDGTSPGTLCVIDIRPRDLAPEMLSSLRMLARQVSAQLSLRRANAGLRIQSEEHRKSRERYRAALTGSQDSILLLECMRDDGGRIVDFVIIDANERGVELAGRPRAEVIGATYGGTFHTARAAGLVERYAEAVESQRGFEEEFVATHPPIRGRALRIQVVPLANGVSLATRDVTERREAELAIRASEQRFDLAVKGSNDGIWDWDLRTNEIYYSPRCDEIMEIGHSGFTRTPESWKERLHPEDRDRAASALRAHLDQRTPYDIEYRLRMSSGEYRWMRGRGQAVWDEQGKALRMVGSRSDIDVQKRTASELARWQARYEAAIRACGQVLYDWDPESNHLVWSENVKQVLGYDEGQLHDLASFAGIMHPEDHARFKAEIERVKATREPFQLEYRLRHADGKYRTVTDRGHFLSIGVGHPDRMVGFLADISETRRLQRLLQIAVDAMPQRVFWKDTNSVYLGCNRAFALDAGQTEPLDLVGHSDYDQQWRQHADLYCADDAAVMRSGTSRLNFEEPYVTGQGSKAWIRTSKIPLRDDAGEVIGVLGTFEDITAERTSKDELRRAKEDAEAANRSKSEFLANMSHEIRTPMTAILGYADLLRGQEAMNPEERAKLVEPILRNGEHLLAIINDILDLSKIEAGKMTVESALVSPEDLIGQVIATMTPRAAAKGVALRSDCDASMPAMVDTDPTRLRQILVNLVGNAVKFTERGSVAVGVSSRQDSRGMHLVMCVTDTGIGMTQEQVDGLFRPFMQADASTTRRFGGTGLGLAVSKRLAELLGGGISIKSTPGQGSEFTLEIRVNAAPTGDTQPAPVIERAKAARETGPLNARILLVEDGIDNQRLISFHLRRAGATVELAGNGAEGIARIAEVERRGESFDVVLMDMQMPVMDGYDAIRELRRRGCRLPVLALTAHAMTGDRETCIAAGCDDYLSKPIDKIGLIAACRMWAARGLGRAAQAITLRARPAADDVQGGN